MAKGNNLNKYRNGKKIKVLSKKFIWEVGAVGTDRLNIVKADELEVI